MIRGLLGLLMMVTPCVAATLTLSNGGALVGAPGETVGWGFELTSTETIWTGVQIPWMVVTRVEFIPNKGTFPVGVFHPYLTGMGRFVVVGPDAGNGEMNPYGEMWDGAAETGLGEVVINDFQVGGDLAVGQVVVTYDVYRVSPNDAMFDPTGDLVASSQQVVAGASVLVAETPEAGSWAMMLAGLAALGIRAAGRTRSRNSCCGRRCRW